MLNQIIRYAPILNFLKKKKTNSILEIWSWSQGLWKFSNIAFDGIDETTADYSENDHKTSENMNFIYGNACKLPFQDNSYDLVFSLDMMEHIPHEYKYKAFEEAIRVWRDTIIIAFPCGIFAKLFDYSLFKVLYILKWGKPPQWWLWEHIEIWLPNENQIKTILSLLQKKYNFSYTSFWNGNIFLRSFIIILENIFWLLWHWYILERISHKIVKANYNFYSYIPYRRFYTIKKSHE